jgi:hypothetical protein
MENSQKRGLSETLNFHNHSKFAILLPSPTPHPKIVPPKSHKRPVNLKIPFTKKLG